MRFGIFYEHQLPRPWERDERQAAGRRARAGGAGRPARVRLRVGGRAPLPRGVLALAAPRRSSWPPPASARAASAWATGSSRLPPAVNHPARVAERVATLDLISGGRVEFGTGEGSSQMELGGFGVDRTRSAPSGRSRWTRSRGCSSRSRSPATRVAGSRCRRETWSPSRGRGPHPPLWVACSRRETILTAAQRGLGALSFSFVEPEAAKEWVDSYYELIASDRCVRPASPSIPTWRWCCR